MRKPIVTALAFGALLVALGHCGGSTFSSGDVDASLPDAANDSPSSTDSGSPPADAGTGDTGAVDSATGVDANGGCVGVVCAPGRVCCGNGVCVNTNNDPLNCGVCGVACMGATPFCDGTCKPEPCTRPGGNCGPGVQCCGSQCCTGGQICCKIEGPAGSGPSCVDPVGQPATCPQGCSPACVSDRNAKRDIRSIDDRAVLDALARVPMSTWSYKTDDPSVRHIGPMAQDFHAELGLGDTDRAYDPIDAHGVAFASIKALYALAQEQNARIERLERENAALREGAEAARVTCGDGR